MPIAWLHWHLDFSGLYLWVVLVRFHFFPVDIAVQCSCGASGSCLYSGRLPDFLRNSTGFPLERDVPRPRSRVFGGCLSRTLSVLCFVRYELGCDYRHCHKLDSTGRIAVRNRTQFFETGNAYLKRKYGGEISCNFASKTSVALTYPVAILGGIIFSGRRYWWGDCLWSAPLLLRRCSTWLSRVTRGLSFWPRHFSGAAA